METFRNVWITIGTISLVLILALSIGLCTNGFKAKVLDIMDAVPEQQLNETQEENVQLLTERSEIEETLRLLNSQKTTLEQTISSLQSSNDENEELLTEYENELDEINEEITNLNTTIDELNAEMTNISTTINGIEVSYVGKMIEMFYPVYDANNQLSHFAGAGDSGNEFWYLSGRDAMYQWNDLYSPMITFANKGIADGVMVELSTFDKYLIRIDGTRYDIKKGVNNFIFDSNTIIDIQIVLNGTEISEEQLNNEVHDNTMYDMFIGFDYELNGNNKITSCVLYTIINDAV